MVRPTSRRFFDSLNNGFGDSDLGSDNSVSNTLHRNAALPSAPGRLAALRGALFGLVALAAAAHADDELDAMFERDALIVVASAHACHRFDVYLALTREQQRRGLMFVRGLPPMTGMLFVYEGAAIRSMWMKNTYIPLDIVFARSDGSVASIATNTEPLSLKSISSIEPVSFALELNAGTTERLFIDRDSLLLWEP